MRSYLFVLFTAILFSTVPVAAQNRSVEFEHGTFSEILAKAKKENKMIYIDCYTSWCGPCKWMAKYVFTNDTVADFYNKNFVNAKIDMEKGEGIEIAKKYNIRAYPTMVFLNSDGVQLHRTCGSASSSMFVTIGKNALVPDKQLATYVANFNGGKVNSTFATSYFSMLESACQPYGTELANYFTTVQDNDLLSRENWGIIYKYVDDYYSKTFQTFEADKTAFAKLYTLDSVENKINLVYTSGLFSAIQNKDMTAYESIKTKLRASKTKESEKFILQADIQLFQYTKDWQKFASSVSDYISKYSVDNANELNSYAWAFYEQIEDKTMLANAEAWAKKATTIENSYAFNDTYAAVLYKSGKKAEAKAAAQYAIDLAKKTGEDYKETEVLLAKIKALK